MSGPVVVSKTQHITVEAANQSVGVINQGPMGPAGPMGSSNAMTGEVRMWAASAVPNDWLECTGAAISRTTYAALFAVIGTTWGVGDNSTTFNIPDMRGRAPIGVGTGTGLTARALAATVGTETHTLTGAQSGVASHSHTLGSHYHSIDPPSTAISATDAGHQHTSYSYSPTGTGGYVLYATPSSDGTLRTTNNVGTGYASISGTVNIAAFNSAGPTGGSDNATPANAAESHNNMQPSLAIKFIIRT